MPKLHSSTLIYVPVLCCCRWAGFQNLPLTPKLPRYSEYTVYNPKYVTLHVHLKPTQIHIIMYRYVSCFLSSCNSHTFTYTHCLTPHVMDCKLLCLHLVQSGTFSISRCQIGRLKYCAQIRLECIKIKNFMLSLHVDYVAGAYYV